MPSIDSKGILKTSRIPMIDRDLVHEMINNENSKAKRMALIKHIREKRMNKILEETPSLRNTKHD